MNRYEMMLLIDPNLGDEKIAELITKIEDKVKSWGGEIEKTEKWGIRRLASKALNAKRLTQAFYAMVFFKAEPTVPEKLRGFLKVTETVVRYQIGRTVVIPQPQRRDVPTAEKKEAAVEAVFVGEIQGEALGKS